MTTTYVDQRVSEAAKLKEDWYIDNANYWITFAKNNKSQQATIDNVNAANGIVDKKTYKYVLDPLSAANVKNKELPVTIRDVDFITPIREKNIGEFIQLPDNYSVKVDDPDITMKLRSDIQAQVNGILQQMLVNYMNQSGDTGVPSKDIPNPEELIEEIKRNVFDDRAIRASKLLEYINDKNDLVNKRIDAFIDWWSTEEFYFRLFEINNELVYDRINPINAFPILNDNQFVHQYSGFVIENKISIHKIKEYYDDRLTLKDQQYLNELLTTVTSNKSTINSDIVLDIYGNRAFSTDDISIARGVELSIQGANMYEHIVYFKTQVPRYILYKLNELGELIAEEVDSKYKANEELGDLEVRKEWIYEVWEQVVLGNLDATGIYLTPRPFPVQIYDDYGMVQLPVFGKYGVSSNININPIPKRIIPNLALYRIITLHIERQLAKFKGAVEIIPKSMLVGSDDKLDPREQMYYRLADNTIIYDDQAISPTLVASGYKIVGNDALGNYIKQLIDLKENIKAEAWDMANMNDSRYGNAPASSTVTNNKDNIYRAKLGSVLMLTVFNNAIGKMYESIIEYCKVIYPKGVANSYFNKSGKVVHFNIPAGELTSNKYGVFVSNSVKDDEKLQQFKDLGFAASQNGEFELAIKTIEADSTAEISKHIQEFNKLNKQFQEKTQAAQAEAVKADKEDTHQNELEAIKLKEDIITARDIKVAGIKTSKQTVS